MVPRTLLDSEPHSNQDLFTNEGNTQCDNAAARPIFPRARITMNEKGTLRSR